MNLYFFYLFTDIRDMIKKTVTESVVEFDHDVESESEEVDTDCDSDTDYNEDNVDAMFGREVYEFYT